MSKYQALIDALNGTSSFNWEHEGGPDVFESGTGIFIASAMESEEAAAYIAAANPATIRSLLADLEMAEKDAERYRWLRATENANRDEWNLFGPYSSPAEIDAAIDAALSQLKGVQ